MIHYIDNNHFESYNPYQNNSLHKLFKSGIWLNVLDS